jgi:flagellar biosynthesis/type III secretory pathway protein FliH
MEMPKFTKTEEQLETQSDKWLYLFKHLPDLQEHPEQLQERIFHRLFEAAEVANFDQAERDRYEQSLKSYRDLQNVLSFAELDGIEKGIEEGITRGIEKGIEQGMVKGIEQGVELGIQQGLVKGIQQGIVKGIEQGVELGIQQGIEQGVELGIQRGVEQGVHQGSYQATARIIQNALGKGFSPAEVASLVDLPLEAIEEFINK